MKLTPAMRELAAGMLRDGRVAVSGESSEDYLQAAAFVFDNGLLYFDKDQRQSLIEALTEPAGRAAITPEPTETMK